VILYGPFITGSGPSVSIPPGADCYTWRVTPRLYKAAEVCELTTVQPYVLRSWEREFPGIGVQKSADSPRMYRQSDVEQIRRIRQLVVGEGLTLAGARRRLEESGTVVSETREDEISEVLDTLGADAKARIATVRSGLRSLLDVLSRTPGALAVPALAVVAPSAPAKRRPATKARVSAKRVVATKRSAAARKPVRVARRSS
jgi:DNA-binding transcriptional MerR regulator